MDVLPIYQLARQPTIPPPLPRLHAPTVYAHICICDRLRENRAQRGVRNIEKRSIDFLKMYCFKRAEGNG